MKYRYAAAALVAAMMLEAPATGALADTMTTRTIVTQRDLPDGEKINFTAFDLNSDQILSMEEVGEKLFYVFDRDGNEILDNMEFYRETVLTVIPMEKTVLKMVDYDDDGLTDIYSYDYDNFVRVSRLIMFDEDRDGLSPADFVQTSFLRTDDNDSKAVELGEWKETYITSLRPLTAEQERYNN